MNLGAPVDPSVEATTKTELERMVAAISQGWLVEHLLDGTHQAPTSVQIDPASFLTETGSGNLVVGTAQAGVVFLYRVRGGCMWLQVLVRGCTVTNTPAQFRVVLPDQWLTKDASICGVGWANDNGTLKTMIVSTTAGAQAVVLSLTPAGTWANSAAGTSFGFTAEFRVVRPGA